MTMGASDNRAKMVQVCRTIFAGLVLRDSILGQIPSCMCSDRDSESSAEAPGRRRFRVTSS